ncbi:MAG: AI-2E family transporter [Candidatus Poribacteria bacterium]|nr:AI-2E family transporter [Candidatus Poribacteria bacterium]
MRSDTESSKASKSLNPTFSGKGTESVDLPKTQSTALVVLLLAGCWIAYAFYMGVNGESNAELSPTGSAKIGLILHPIFAVLLLFLLSTIWSYVYPTCVATFEIIFVSLWLFLRLVDVMMPFILGFGFAYLFRFVIGEMQEIPLPFGRRLRIPKIVASLLLLGLTLSLLFLAIWLIIPQIGEQGIAMSQGLIKFYQESVVPFVSGTEEQKGILDQLENWGSSSKYQPIQGFTQFAKLEGKKIITQIQGYLTTNLGIIAESGTDLFSRIFKGFSAVAIGFGGFLTTLFLALLVFIYATQSLEDYAHRFVELFSSEQQDVIWQYLREIHQNMESFLRGQVIVICVISLISIVVYSIIGVPFALVVGLLAGLSNAIPTFGPFIGGIFAFLSLLMGFATGGFTLVGFLLRMIAVLVAIIGIQTLDNALISPKIMSSAVDIDPLMIMFGVVAGAALFGFWGVILAIPALVVIKSILSVRQKLAS